MTEQLEAAWKSSAKPFHHETVFSSDLVPLHALQPFVRSAVRHIETYYPNAQLLTFEDWHAHDGFIVTPKAISLAGLAAKVETPDSLYLWRHGDFEVFRSVYPESMDFLLRIDVLDEDEDADEYPGIWGSFSFSGFGFDLTELHKRAHGNTEITLASELSKDYFDRIHAG